MPHKRDGYGAGSSTSTAASSLRSQPATRADRPPARCARCRPRKPHLASTGRTAFGAQRFPTARPPRRRAVAWRWRRRPRPAHATGTQPERDSLAALETQPIVERALAPGAGISNEREFWNLRCACTSRGARSERKRNVTKARCRNRAGSIHADTRSVQESATAVAIGPSDARVRFETVQPARARTGRGAARCPGHARAGESSLRSPTPQPRIARCPRRKLAVARHPRTRPPERTSACASNQPHLTAASTGTRASSGPLRSPRVVRMVFFPTLGVPSRGRRFVGR